ncbi:unnamed protein product [Choristocarpus tenellus]
MLEDLRSEVADPGQQTIQKMTSHVVPSPAEYSGLARQHRPRSTKAEKLVHKLVGSNRSPEFIYKNKTTPFNDYSLESPPVKKSVVLSGYSSPHQRIPYKVDEGSEENLKIRSRMATGRSDHSPRPPVVIRREQCGWYTSHYCEENVIRLCKTIAEGKSINLDNLYIVFISNRKKQVPLWCQRLSGNDREPVLWDYHVVLVAIHDGTFWIYDHDSTLPFPCEASTYTTQSFRRDAALNASYQQFFRVVKAKKCLDHFASNRSHMRLHGGGYSAPPPETSPIRGRKAMKAHNLGDWINMIPGTWKGDVMDLNAFEVFLNPARFR